MTELPSGTVTFLFTDLEGSTRLWEEHPDAMQSALARHDELVRAAIEASSGTVVKTTGDGFHAAFAVAADAVDAAIAAQLALAGEPWEATGPLRVRIGLHTGAAELRDGDYYSSAVNRAARLMSVANGGQIVVSLATSELVRESDVELFDLGEHRLRDLTVAERVYEVRAPGLASGFPPLRSLDAFPGNLPRQLTSFVGRDQELSAIAKALGDWRLVTLTGTGGVGKTRLAVQVAAEVLPRFRDGAWLCELAVAADGETMAQVVAAELGVSQRPGMSLEASVSEYLRSKDLLLVLDNCEQLLGPVSVFAENLLRDCPGVRILATSREGLAVGGEHVLPLRSLPLPDATGVGAETNDAVRLFVERAEAARATFVLDGSNVGAVGEICRRLDGIPLAIELAAARVVSMSPVEISGLLDERFRLLTGGRRSAVERHQTLRATVDWSYSLLTEVERTVFDRLGVFAGSFDATAAQAVVLGDGVERWDVLDALAELVAKSMVVAEEAADGTTRYQMLETLRQYARERLDEQGDIDVWRRRHGECFAAWAEEAGPGLAGADEVTWRIRMADDLDNLRAAMMWALERDEPADADLAMRIIGALADESVHDPALDVGSWAAEALPRVEITSPELRYAVTAAAASHHMQIGNYRLAEELALAAIGDGVPLGAPAPGVAYVTVGHSVSLLGEIERGLALLLAASHEIDRDFKGTAAASYLHSQAAMAAYQLGDPVARSEAEVALRAAREIANPTSLASSLSAYGMALSDVDPTAALVALDESLAMGRQGASPGALGMALQVAASLRMRGGEHVQAARELREAIGHADQVGSRPLFYITASSGTEILAGFERFTEVAAFDGIVSAGLSESFRSGAPMARSFRVASESARAAVGSGEYDAAFEVGAAMTYDQAVEHALRAFNDLIRDLDDA